MSGGVTSQNASNLLVPGAYVNPEQQQNQVQPFVNTALNGRVGTANWGLVNTPIPTNSTGTSQFGAIYNALGNSTTNKYDLVPQLVLELPEGGSDVNIRVTDGTDTAAVIAILDNSSGTVATLTANCTGSYPDGDAALGIAAASCRIDLVSSSTSGANTINQVFRATIFFPNATPEVFNGIIGYAALNGQYDPTTFKANLLAAINGTAANSVGSKRWTASSGSSVLVPKTATLFAASGGTDGSSGVTPAMLIGTDGGVGARTGMYALRGSKVFHVGICGLDDLSYAQTISAFATSENIALGFITVPKGTTDSAAFALRLANGVVDDNMVIVKDYVKMFDPVQQVFSFFSPEGKAMGITALCPPEVSTISEPYNITGNGAGQVISTEASIAGPRSDDELAALITNGFISVTNQTPLNNGAFAIFDDVCSSGDPRANNGTGNYIPVVRMTTYLSRAFVQLLGPYVGKNQSTAPDDPVRAGIEGTLNNFLSQLKPEGGTQRIDLYGVTCDLTNNTPATIAEGYCFVTVAVRYLGVIRILYVTLNAGTGVTVSNNPPPQLQAA